MQGQNWQLHCGGRHEWIRASATRVEEALGVRYAHSDEAMKGQTAYPYVATYSPLTTAFVPERSVSKHDTQRNLRQMVGEMRTVTLDGALSVVILNGRNTVKEGGKG